MSEAVDTPVLPRYMAPPDTGPWRAIGEPFRDSTEPDPVCPVCGRKPETGYPYYFLAVRWPGTVSTQWYHWCPSVIFI